MRRSHYSVAAHLPAHVQVNYATARSDDPHVLRAATVIKFDSPDQILVEVCRPPGARLERGRASGDQQNQQKRGT